MEVLFEVDRLTRSKTIFHYDPTNDHVHLETIADVQPIIDQNKRDQNAVDHSTRRTGELNRVASIPLDVLFAWRREWRDKDLSWEERQEDLKRKLNDPDLRFFRTDNGSRL
jgi:hypothetical protein